MPDIPEEHDPDSPLSQAERRARMQLEWDNLIEELIAEGREKGLFDNLPGRGKPLRLAPNPHAPELDLAHRLLKDNQLAPAWITDRRELLADIEALRREMAQTWQRYRREYDVLAAGRAAVVARWAGRCHSWMAAIGDLNRRIERYNLKRPSERLELFKLDLERELRRIGARRQLD